MAERRQVARRDPIIIETSQGDVVVEPLPWMQRNDLGDKILQSYAESINSMVGAMSTDPETGRVSTGGAHFDDKAFNWDGIIDLALPSVDRGLIDKLDITELRTCLLASLEVNKLESLGSMIDPNFQPPSQEGREDQQDGQKIISLPDSGSPDILATKSPN